ncbi:carbon-nitrogen hydrolase family protein, partial [Micromonospora chalcea]|uniref:carbon-nitrogen hydrolase family protein n=1 Tax=Micromonospora chalcea TaxID=1874 RepID=UPI0021A916CC
DLTRPPIHIDGYRVVVRTGVCQTPESLGDVGLAMDTIHDFAEQARIADLDVSLFPECFLQGYLVTEPHVRDQALGLGSPRLTSVLARLAGSRQTLALGMIERHRGPYHNTALVIAGGKALGTYRKTHPTSGESLFAPGDTCPVFEHASVRFGINICYDTPFSPAAAAVAAGGAQLILVPAQNMMRRDRAFWWQERHNRSGSGGSARPAGGWTPPTSTANAASSE